MSRRIKTLLWLYLIGGFVTFVFQIGIRLTNCVGRDACLLSIAKAPVWSLIWPFSWGVLTAGLSFQAILVAVLLLLLLFVVGEGFYRVFAALDAKSRASLEDVQSRYAWPCELAIGACALMAL